MATKLALTQRIKQKKSFINIISNIQHLWSLIAALGTTTLILLEFGFHLNTANQHLFSTLYHYLYLFFIINYLILLITEKKPLSFLKKNNYIFLLFFPFINLKTNIIDQTQSYQITLSILAFIHFTKHFQGLKKMAVSFHLEKCKERAKKFMKQT